jgi:hypothetical protein
MGLQYFLQNIYCFAKYFCFVGYDQDFEYKGRNPFAFHLEFDVVLFPLNFKYNRH